MADREPTLPSEPSGGARSNGARSDRPSSGGPPSVGSASGASSNPTRGLLFCELRGYAAFAQRHGGRVAAHLLDAYRALVREAIEATGGREVLSEGKSFSVVFDSAYAAVHCGLAIMGAAAQATAENPRWPMHVAVGIHAVEPVAPGESIVGPTIAGEGYAASAANIAALICAEAYAGDVLVTDTVRSQVGTSLQAVGLEEVGLEEVGFRSRGRLRLEGIPEPIELFAASAPGTLVASTSPGILGTGPLAGSGPIWTAVLSLVALASLMVPLAYLLAQATGTGGAPSATPTGGSGSATPSASALPAASAQPTGSSQPTGSAQPAASASGPSPTPLGLLTGRIYIVGSEGVRLVFSSTVARSAPRA